ncbi:MAG: hypothetical protein QOD53_2405 [Thermoleophilaceae bacterium]|jgi:hypothetical protein|nr:hypothetical protein [Thermoleophilaceae bacterium]
MHLPKPLALALLCAAIAALLVVPATTPASHVVAAKSKKVKVKSGYYNSNSAFTHKYGVVLNIKHRKITNLSVSGHLCDDDETVTSPQPNKPLLSLKINAKGRFNAHFNATAEQGSGDRRDENADGTIKGKANGDKVKGTVSVVFHFDRPGGGTDSCTTPPLKFTALRY